MKIKSIYADSQMDEEAVFYLSNVAGHLWGHAYSIEKRDDGTLLPKFNGSKCELDIFPETMRVVVESEGVREVRSSGQYDLHVFRKADEKRSWDQLVSDIEYECPKVTVIRSSRDCPQEEEWEC